MYETESCMHQTCNALICKTLTIRHTHTQTYTPVYHTHSPELSFQFTNDSEQEFELSRVAPPRDGLNSMGKVFVPSKKHQVLPGRREREREGRERERERKREREGEREREKEVVREEREG